MQLDHFNIENTDINQNSQNNEYSTLFILKYMLYVTINLTNVQPNFKSNKDR